MPLEQFQDHNWLCNSLNKLYISCEIVLRDSKCYLHFYLRLSSIITYIYISIVFLKLLACFFFFCFKSPWYLGLHCILDQSSFYFCLGTFDLAFEKVFERFLLTSLGKENLRKLLLGMNWFLSLSFVTHLSFLGAAWRNLTFSFSLEILRSKTRKTLWQSL